MNWLTDKPIAHRGLHDGKAVPENSLPAFEAAIREEFPIELDVHVLRDGNVVVFHDDDLRRATGHRGLVCEWTSRQLLALQLFETPNRIPLLQEVLELVNGTVPLLIEIKNSTKVGILEGRLQALLKHYRGEFAVQSFNPLSMEWFRRNAPGVLRGQLSGDFRDSSLPVYKKFILRRMWLNWRSQPHFIAYDHRALPNRWVECEARRRGIPVLAWTVRNEAEQKRALSVADNIIFEGFSP
jgi:glycerophosphoryl diester phosphodiesterase